MPSRATIRTVHGGGAVSDITFWFFIFSGIVGIGCAAFGAWHLVTRNGSARENALWVARGVLILALLWWLVS